MASVRFSLIKLILLFSLLLPASTFVIAADSGAAPSAFAPTSHVPSTKNPKTKMFAFPSSKKESISTFAGKIAPVLEKLWITPDKAKNIGIAIKTVTEPADLFFILFVGWFLLPLVQIPYEKFYMKNADDNSVDIQKSDVLNSPVKVKKEFRDTKLFFYTHLIAEAGRIAGLVYLVDCLAIALAVLGFNVQNTSKLCAKTIYTAWIFTRVNALRKYLIKKAFR